MKKDKLKKMPLVTSINSTWGHMIKQLKDTSMKYLVTVSKEEDIYSLSFYDIAEGNIRYRLFINREDYITQDFTSSKVKWRTGSMNNILNYKSWDVVSFIPSSNDLKLLSSLLGTDTNLLHELVILQETIKHKRLEKKHLSIKSGIDKIMDKVPKTLPASFERWLNDEGLYHSRYIYYEYKPKKMVKGYCTHCGSEVLIDRPRHNDEGSCPVCNSRIIYKAKKKAGKIFDNGKAAIIQKITDGSNGLVIRYFNITKDYQDYKNPKLNYHEARRDFFDSEGNFSIYSFDFFKSTNELRWVEGIREGGMFYRKDFDFGNTTLYTRNLSRVIKNTPFEYSAIREYIGNEKGIEFFPSIYLKYYLYFPALEYIVKLGLKRLADEVINYDYMYKEIINYQGKNLQEIFNLNKNNFKRFIKLNKGFSVLEILQTMERENLEFSNDDILYIDNHFNIRDVSFMLKYTTFHKIKVYINKQVKLLRNRKDKAALSDWVDYIKDVEYLNYDLSTFVLFPKNIDTAHTNIMRLVKDRELELFNEAFSKLYSEWYRLFGWTDKNYIIVPPKSFDEVIEEGNNLHHCVGGTVYGEKVSKKKSVILFLRDKMEPDKSLYTIELDPKRRKIIQCRGKNNKQYGEEISAVLESFTKSKNLIVA